MSISLKTCLIIASLLFSAQAFSGSVDLLLRQADSWASRDRVDLARKTIDKLFRIAPENADALAQLCFLELRDKNIAGAKQSLKRLIAADPKHAEIDNINTMLRIMGPDKQKLQQARLLAKAGQAEAAIQSYDNLFPNGMPSAPLAYEYWMLVGDTKAGWQAARTGLKQLLKKHPDSLRYQLALIEHELSRDPGNRELLSQLHGFIDNPRYQRQASASWRRAVFRLGEVADSIPYYQEYLAYDPKDEVIQQLLDQVQQAQKDHATRLKDPAYLAKLEGMKYLHRNNLKKAEKNFKIALKSYPNDIDAIGGMGTIRLRQGRHSEAQRYFKKARKLNPDNAAKWQSLGQTSAFWGLLAKAEKQQQQGQLNNAENSIRRALAIEQHPAALSSLASIQLQQGKIGKAIKTYKTILKSYNDNNTALRGLINLYIDQGQLSQARNMLAKLNKKQRLSLAKNYKQLHARLLRAEADVFIRKGQLQQATQKLELARQYQNKDAWLLYDLAQLYKQQGMAEKIIPRFESALKQSPNNSELLYAYALFSDSLDNEDKALVLIHKIPPQDWTKNITTTEQRLQVKQQRKISRQQFANNQAEEAASTMQTLEQRMQGLPERLLEVSQGWADIGQTERGLSLLEGIHFNASDNKQIEQQRLRLQLKQAAHYRQLGQHEKALSLLQNVEQRLAGQDDVLQEKAALYRAMNQPALAADYYQQLYTQKPQEQWIAFALLGTLIEAGQLEQAKQLATEINNKLQNTDINHRISMVETWYDIGDTRQAEQLLDQLSNDFPQNPAVLSLAAQQAQHKGNDDQALSLYKQAKHFYPHFYPRQNNAANKLQLPQLASLDDNINQLTAERSNTFSIAYDLTERNETDGKSTLRTEQIPVEFRLASINNGHIFFRADQVNLDSGSLDRFDATEIQQFGQGLFCFPNCNAASLQQKTKGTSFAIGYQNRQLRLDIGTTPLGFLVEDLVGGIRVDGDLGIFSWGIDISRRAMTGTQLSYAGAKDVNSGKIWGGVKTNGIRFSLSHDDGGPIGYWSNMDFHYIDGKNVASNKRFRLMGGAYWKFVNNNTQQMSIGLNGQFWRHQKTLDEFTFGQGGYYSPNRYQSLSIPFDLYGRYNDKLSYRFRASISQSWTYEETTAYFPNDPDLQAAAEALEASTGVNPYFEGGNGGGFGYSLLGAVEYKLQQHLAIGFEVSTDQSDFYQPVRAIAYLRYTFDGDKRPVWSPPSPLQPYSDF